MLYEFTNYKYNGKVQVTNPNLSWELFTEKFKSYLKKKRIYALDIYINLGFMGKNLSGPECT